MENIPLFPNFTGIDLIHQTELERILKLYPVLISDLTYAALFVWRKICRYEIACLDECLIVRGIDPVSKENYLLPILGPVGIKEVKQIRDYYLTQNRSLVFYYADSTFTNLIRSQFTQAEIIPDRDYFDYVYRQQDLASLSGKKYDGKRNHIHNFKKKFKYTFVSLLPEHLPQCREVFTRWLDTRKDKEFSQLTIDMERQAVEETLNYYVSLHLLGAGIIVNDRLRAFLVAEELNPQTMVVHIQKTDPEFKGIGDLLNREFARILCAEYKYINWEQDVGVLGLRKYKLSYYPDFMVEKHIVRIK